MIRLWLSLAIGCVSSQCYSQESGSNDFYLANGNDDQYQSGGQFAEDISWEEQAVLGEELPMVLTAARLKQPKAEVPASVTIITAQQIKLWGVRTLPELMKFVPGMFVGHADDERGQIDAQCNVCSGRLCGDGVGVLVLSGKL